jgi:hypothetical protein
LFLPQSEKRLVLDSHGFRVHGFLAGYTFLILACESGRSGD